MQQPPPADPLVTRADIARLAGVKPPAVTNWTKRHSDFPTPLSSEGTEYFRLSDVLEWLATRTIPSSSRTGQEAASSTYADRARRRLPAPPHDSPAAVTHRTRIPRAPHDAGDSEEAARLVAELTGPLAVRVRGSGTMADFVNLLASLALIRVGAPEHWQGLMRTAPPEPSAQEAARLLHRIGRMADKLLSAQGIPPGMEVSLRKLHPASHNDLMHTIRLTASLRFLAFQDLLENFGNHEGLKSGEFFTPRAVTRLMSDMLFSEGSTPLGAVCDPYARGGELLAAAFTALRAANKQAPSITAHGTVPSPSMLRLSAVHLALHGAPARLAPGSPTPWEDGTDPIPGGAQYVLTNPPFNDASSPVSKRHEREWRFGAPPSHNHNLAWPQHVIDMLAPTGRAAIVMPNIAADSAQQSEQLIRQRLVERGAVECVLALPPHLFASTTIPVSVWFLRPPSHDNDEVLFIDGSRMGSREAGGQRHLTDEEVRTTSDAYRTWRSDRACGVPHAGIPGFSAVASPVQISAGNYSLSPGDYVQDTSRTPPTRAKLQQALTRAGLSLDDLRMRTSAADAAVPQNLKRTATELDFLMALLGEAWERPKLADLCDIQAGPSYSRLPATERSPDGTIPVVHPKHLHSRRVARPTQELVSREVAEKFRKFQLMEGDILCVRSGTTGPSALVQEAQAGWLSSTNLLRLRMRSAPPLNVAPRYLPEYLIAYLSLPTVQEWIRKRSRSRTAIASISTASLGQLEIRLPSMELQHRVGAQLATLDDQIAAHRAFADAADTARSALSDYLLSDALLAE
ncbi:N-6 DNA methylase [Streptomyces inhibens]|uniref:N-6 DNA methylase n=1 Tax=Streptomyces inhibens TaxID=2293571 RepID=UPI003676D9C0